MVGLAASFGPAVTIVVAVALLGERLKPIQWAGLAGIGIGMIAIAIRRKGRRRPRGRTAAPARRQPGRLNQNRVRPFADSAPTWPPPCSTSCLTTASPIPAPPRARSRDFSTR